MFTYQGLIPGVGTIIFTRNKEKLLILYSVKKCVYVQKQLIQIILVNVSTFVENVKKLLCILIRKYCSSKTALK